MPYIGDKAYDKVLVDLNYWRDEATSAHAREAKLVIEIRNGQGKINRLQDQLERFEMIGEARDGHRDIEPPLGIADGDITNVSNTDGTL